MAADSATEAADGAASAPLELSTLCPDALQDSYAAVYSLLVVAPLTALASRWLLSRGKRTTPTQVLLLSLLVPALLIGIPAWYQGTYRDQSVYHMLKMSRLETRYVWAQKYAYLRHQFQEGAMPLHVWQQIDSAYDHIYNEKSRFLYDFWGPGQEKLSLRETQLNVGFFYLLWTGIIYAVTSPKAAREGSKWAYTSLVLLLCFEVAVRLLHYDPKFKVLFPFTTPREFVRWGHRLFPVFAFAAISVKRTFFVDLDKHHQVVLRHMLEKNQKTMGTLKAIENALSPEEEAEESSEK